MSKFEQFAKYPTRNGGTALILRVFSDGSTDSALFLPGDDYRGITRHFPSGRLYGASENEWDILPPEPEKHVVWLNVYQTTVGLWGQLARGREEAETAAKVRPISAERVGCHRVTLRAEFEDETP